MIYGTKAVERVWLRNEDYVRNNITKKLWYKYHPQTTLEETFAEIRLLYFLNFYEYYEEDTQYNAFIFSCGKNKLINKGKLYVNEKKIFITDPKSIASSIGLFIDSDTEDCSHVWNNIPGKDDVFWKIMIKDIIKKCKAKLDDTTKKLIECIMYGLTVRETCRELGITKNTYIYKMHILKREIKELWKIEIENIKQS